jgi:hypothetical protein
MAPRGRGRSLASKRADEVDEEILEGDREKAAAPRSLSVEQTLKERFAVTSSDTKEVEVSLAEQPLSEPERDLVRRYREINNFLKLSPFHVREPAKEQHAGAS